MGPGALARRQRLRGHRGPLFYGGVPGRERRDTGYARNTLLEEFADRQGAWTRHPRAGAAGGRGHTNRASLATGLRGTERLRRPEEDEPAAARTDEFHLAGIHRRAAHPR